MERNGPDGRPSEARASPEQCGFDARDEASWPVLLTVREVASILRADPKTVRRMTDRGTLAYVRGGQGLTRVKRLVTRASVKAFIANVVAPEVKVDARWTKAIQRPNSFLGRFTKPLRQRR